MVRFTFTVGFRVRDRVRIRVMVRARVWIVWYMNAQTAVRIHTDNSPEMTHLSVWIPTDNNTMVVDSLTYRSQ